MKKNTATICKTATTLITGIALATLLQVGISFAKSNGQDLKPGTIRIQQDESAYPGLAKITMEQARDTALSNVQGKVLKIELENENGFLVYSVELVTSDKNITDVKVDAGNGKILLVENDSSNKDKEGYDKQDRNDHHDGDSEDNDHEGQDLD